VTIRDAAWWPPLLRSLLDEFDPLLIRRTGETVLGFPPDAFGVSYDQYKELLAALQTT